MPGSLWFVNFKLYYFKALAFFLKIRYNIYRGFYWGGLCVSSHLKDEFTDQLFEAILALESVEEAYKFFEDVCTVNEIKALGQRLQVAKMLDEGATYDKIAEATGASTATISRVKRCLNYGPGGYQLILKRLSETE